MKTKQTIFERMGGTYTLGEDGIYYPNLVLGEDTPHYGKYGGMRKRYLQQHRPALYAQLVLEGKLNHALTCTGKADSSETSFPADFHEFHFCFVFVAATH